MARTHWPGEDAVGKRYRPVWWQDRWIEVVGVVRDVRHQGLGQEVLPETYRPFAQEPTASMTVVLRGSGDPRAAAGALAAVLRSIDREVPVSEVRTVGQVISESVVQPRVTMLVLGLFAGIALLLAAIGIYGIVSYTVGRRSHEMGVRMALGARGSEVMRLVLRHGARLAAVGLVIGTVAALALTRLMEHLLYGVDARDPLTFMIAAGTLLTAALLASYLPARRAARIDPLRAMRTE
jgi:putative ABC transport system permease protein